MTQTTTDGFPVARPIAARAATATSAKASVLLGDIVPGFQVRRAVAGRAAVATWAKATLSTGRGGQDFNLHVTEGVPSIGYHSGEYWVMRVTNGGVPTITPR